MKKRWSVIAVGDGWSYRDDVHGAKFFTRIGARRYAKALAEQGPWAVPLRMVVERLP